MLNNESIMSPYPRGLKSLMRNRTNKQRMKVHGNEFLLEEGISSCERSKERN